MIVRKICAGFFVAILLAMGIACGGGGGGSSAVVWPTLPEGTLHVYEEGMPGEYLDVSLLDYFTPGGIWQFGYFLWFNCYGEDGVIFVIEPDDPEEEVARLSVAVHPRGMNWTQETWDYINDPEHPENKFLVYEIMEGLEGGGMAGIIGGALEADFYITAGGEYQRQMKEGAQEMVDYYYGMIPLPDLIKQILLPKEDFQAYLSQQIYESKYVGGARLGGPGNGGFSELAAMLLEPWNWERTDFVVTLDLVSTFSNLLTDRVAVSGLEYGTNSLFLGNRIYRGDGTNTTGYRLTAFPEEITGRQFIRTQYGDAGRAENPFLTFNLTRASTLYVAVDSTMAVDSTLITWLTGNGWTLWNGETITAARTRSDPGDTITFNLYYKEYGDVEEYPLAIALPGNGDATKKMYLVIADAGTYPVGIEIIATAHTTLIEDNPADVAAYSPSLKAEGGIVCTGIDIDGAEIRGEPVDLTHVDFVENCDSNVFVNTEGGDYGLQTAVNEVTNIQFVDHVLKNNAFRLIDTYNDLAPAFGGDSQVLEVENMLGFPMGDYSIRVPLDENTLVSFANMNLLNSPNLIGVYLKSIATDTGIQVWREEDAHKGLNYLAVRNHIRDNAVSYRYFLSSTGAEISLIDLLKRIGNRNEGETTFSILVGFEDTTTFEISAGAFIQDYFTNIYDPVIGGIAPVGVFTGEIKE
ncbi:MAG: hypothetical protein JW957_07905 [Candidatus Omnitrophica bacterium]|nr:hypothetical protein [Candidatus Omnitrophota bacterium]